MQRVLIGLVFGAAVTFGLFLVMSVLVKGGDGEFSKKEYEAIDFGEVKVDDQIKRKERRVPKKPPPPKEPPPPETQKVSKVPNPNIQNINIELSKLDVNVGAGGVFIGNMAQMMSQDGDAIPLVTIEPQYPRKAALEGIEGWVKFKFTVKPDGYVKDVKIVESKPRRIFDKDARRAIYKWRFKPRVVDGQAIEQPNMSYKLEFRLND